MNYTRNGKQVTMSAKHVFRSEIDDIVKVDGHDVTDEDIDFDIDVHLLRADFEYHLRYMDQGTPHKVKLTASVDWFNL